LLKSRSEKELRDLLGERYSELLVILHTLRDGQAISELNREVNGLISDEFVKNMIRTKS
jgi:hypothetical protein